jgi:ElaB/YqjD/DUF883 family membrane-anchored ribosome-binding protein
MSKKHINQKAENFEGQAQQAVSDLRERARSWQQAAVDRTLEFRDTTDHYVRHNPWSVIGLVALFAFTFGLLAGARRRPYIIER